MFSGIFCRCIREKKLYEPELVCNSCLNAYDKPDLCAINLTDIRVILDLYVMDLTCAAQ